MQSILDQSAIYRSKLTKNAEDILQKRYLQPDESIDEMYRRVSGDNERFYNLMKTLDFHPNSPALMNKGTGKGTSSACFVFYVDDSLLEGNNSIMGTAYKAAAVAKWGGGVGYYLGDLRPKGSKIQSTHKVACGPVAVLKYYNELGKLITQGGRRELAQMGILNCDHKDLLEFIHCKDKDPQSIRTFNISVLCTDEFMEKSKIKGTKEYDIWQELVKSAWTTGDPGIVFFDTANKDNPTKHLGYFKGTNPCSEYMSHNNESCNLGSINLANFITVNGEVNWNRLEEVTIDSIDFLDHILDTNRYPHPDITEAVYKTRDIGLGVMGWADMLALMHIPYASEKAVVLAEEVMCFINTIARDRSIYLAKTKNGPYPASQNDPCHHSCRTIIAPTGTISILCGCSSGIEPHYALEWDRTINAGNKEKEYVIKEKIAVWDKLDGFIPQIANEIPYQWHIRHQAAFQKHLDKACSKTINLPNSATVEDVDKAYRYMHELGCKGGTIFRDGCRSGGEQVLKATKHESNGYSVNTANNLGGYDDPKTNAITIIPSINGFSTTPMMASILTQLNSAGYPGPTAVKEMTEHKNGQLMIESISGKIKSSSCRRKLPDERNSLTHKFSVGQVEGYLTVGLYDDGTPGEIFVTVAKEGSTVSGLLDAWATSISLNLQHGLSVESISQKFSGTRFEPAGMTINKTIPIATSIVDYIVRWLDLKYGSGHSKGQTITGSGMVCPDCTAEAIYQGGCLTCVKTCGWSKCG